MDLNTLKNEYAQEQGYEDWIEFLNNLPNYAIESHMDEICIRARKAALPFDEELIKKLWYARNPSHDYDSNNVDRFWKTAFMVFEDYRTSITNPENLIR